MAAPKRFPDRDEIAAVRAEAERLEAGGEAETKRRLAGRVLARRGHGKLVFLDLVDRFAEESRRCAPQLSSAQSTLATSRGQRRAKLASAAGGSALAD